MIVIQVYDKDTHTATESELFDWMKNRIQKAEHNAEIYTDKASTDPTDTFDTFNAFRKKYKDKN